MEQKLDWLQQELITTKKKNTRLKVKLQATEKKIEIQEERVKTLEREVRKRNVIYGVEEEKDDTEGSLKCKIKNKKIDVELQAETEIQKTYRIGKSLTNSNNERPEW